jgi:hypothetical protein
MVEQDKSMYQVNLDKKLTRYINPSSASSLLTARVNLIQCLIQPQHGHGNHSRAIYFSHLRDSFCTSAIAAGDRQGKNLALLDQ